MFAAPKGRRNVAGGGAAMLSLAAEPPVGYRDEFSPAVEVCRRRGEADTAPLA